MARPVAGLNRGGIRSGGRVTGKPNKVSVEARTLAMELVASPVYQERLRRDFERRRLHPAIETLVWSYGYGKPVQPILHGGSVGALDTSSRLAEERKAFAQLDLADLEALAGESQRLLDRALQLARTAGEVVSEPSPAADEPQDVVVQSVTEDG